MNWYTAKASVSASCPRTSQGASPDHQITPKPRNTIGWSTNSTAWSHISPGLQTRA